MTMDVWMFVFGFHSRGRCCSHQLGPKGHGQDDSGQGWERDHHERWSHHPFAYGGMQSFINSGWSLTDVGVSFRTQSHFGIMRNRSNRKRAKHEERSNEGLTLLVRTSGTES